MSCGNQDTSTRGSDLILESGPIARGLETFRQSAPASIRDRIGCCLQEPGKRLFQALMKGGLLMSPPY